jgi:pyruvate formate lyase activating enzyme
MNLSGRFANRPCGPVVAMIYSIKGFVETSFSDWSGKVVSVLFLPSCNLRCPFCHNHELVRRPEAYDDFPWGTILESLRRRKGWIDGVCLTGGEPTLHPWLLPLIRELKSKRDLTSSGEPLAVKLDTNGTHPEILENLLRQGLLDYVAMDLKSPLEADRYSALTGVSFSGAQMERVRASVQLLLRGNVDYEFRTTVVPCLLEEEEICAIARGIRGAARYTLQNFNPRETLDPRLREAAPLGASALQRMQEKVNQVIWEKEANFKLGVRSSEFGVSKIQRGERAPAV